MLPQPNILTPPSVYWNSFIMLYNDFELSLGYVHTISLAPVFDW
jgi:hypothetical protein